MYRLKIKKYAFTLAETVIVCSVFAVFVVGLIIMINRAYVFINNTRASVMATNFAREGVEMIYNIRDTNRRKYSGMKDANWFKDVCEENGVCVILEKKESNGDSTVRIEPVIGLEGHSLITCSSIYSGIDYDDAYSVFSFIDRVRGNECSQYFNIYDGMIYSGTYFYYSGGALAEGKVGDLFEGKGTEFFRVFRHYGYYDKLSGNKVNPGDVFSGKPMEMRFCVVVYYRNNGNAHKKELCSIMTNFME